MTKYTEIEGLTEVTRLPRLGKIRLGVKVPHKTKKVKDPETGKDVPATYPREVDYFVVPPEVEEVYGPTPKELDILLPVNDRRIIFPQSYRLYGKIGLKCSGNGINSTYVNEAWEMVDHQEGFCPCGHYNNGEGPCKRMGVLQFILPKVSISGVYQITTQSVNSIIDINSGLKYCIAQVGRFAWIPLKLRRVSTRTNHKGQPGNHYTLSLVPDIKLEQLNDLRADTSRLLEYSKHYAVEEPDLSNPAEEEGFTKDCPIDKEPATEPKTSRKTAKADRPPTTPPPPPETQHADEDVQACGGESGAGEHETTGPQSEPGNEPGAIDYTIKITDDHINEVVALTSTLKVENLDELLTARGLPPFNTDFPEALFEDLVEIMREASDRLPFVLDPRQGQESFLTIEQVRVIDQARNAAGIDSGVFGQFLLELVGSNTLMKIRVKHVQACMKWIQEKKGV